VTLAGQLDTSSFNYPNGFVSYDVGGLNQGDSACGVAIPGSTEKIVVAGSCGSYFAVARFTSSGARDTGPNGFGQGTETGTQLVLTRSTLKPRN
jgi:hypothetical protein